LSNQQTEIDKYKKVYQVEEYRMGGARKAYAEENVQSATDCASYLDVGCGRGEMVAFSRNLGMDSKGVEAVDYLTNGDDVVQGLAWDLPFKSKSIDLVTLFDVIEHILPEDTFKVLHELGRVAKKRLFITAANYSSKSLGEELHINIKDYSEWDKVIREAFPTATVTWLPRKHNIASETWSVQLG
jgi:ubiquinone/menaquinone biosynthesis C-methylase UbiE